MFWEVNVKCKKYSFFKKNNNNKLSERKPACSLCYVRWLDKWLKFILHFSSITSGEGIWEEGGVCYTFALLLKSQIRSDVRDSQFYKEPLSRGADP